VRQAIPADAMCPAAGQGALGIEIRQGDASTRQQVVFLDDSSARAATTCERALLNAMGGGCQVPIGAFAEVGPDGKTLHLRAVVAHPDGSTVLRESRKGSDPLQLGIAVGRTLLGRGGSAILDAIYSAGSGHK
jgi:hydroxymethylbilane synthase